MAVKSPSPCSRIGSIKNSATSFVCWLPKWRSCPCCLHRRTLHHTITFVASPRQNGQGNGVPKMAECLQMLFFLFKSKYRRKYLFGPICIFVVFLSSTFIDVVLSANCTSLECVNGVCVNGTNCVCFDGWQGPSCQFCGGKVRWVARFLSPFILAALFHFLFLFFISRLTEWSGIIHDGPGNYSKDVKCSWLVLAGTGANATIRLHMEEFATECGWDHLYIFDGDSIDSPLLAVFRLVDSTQKLTKTGSSLKKKK